MEHPIQRLVESIHRDGSCPRLQVDLTRPGIVCPDFVCEKWGEKLIIDLDPSYPLDLRFTATGIDVDLSFGGYVSRCTFPYAAIYMVADRATGKGMLFEENAPESARPKRRPAPALAIERGESSEAKRSSESRKKETTKRRSRGAGESRRRRRRGKGADESTGSETQVRAEESKEPKRLGLVALRPVEDEPAELPPSLGVAKPEPAGAKSKVETEKEPKPEKQKEKEKQKKEEKTESSTERRRSMFRVIDGGKSDSNSETPD